MGRFDRKIIFHFLALVDPLYHAKPPQLIIAIRGSSFFSAPLPSSGLASSSQSGLQLRPAMLRCADAANTLTV